MGSRSDSNGNCARGAANPASEPVRALEAEERFVRRRAAMAFLDVVGYSRLMGADEDATLRRWSAMRSRVIQPRLRRWRGRVVDRAGDGLFVELPSALHAMRWAVDVQTALIPAAAEDPPMQVRVAVHVGDVIAGKRGELHGDGVNIAARLQAYAEGGCVIASKAAVDAVFGAFEGAFLDLGELHLRNMLRPVHAFSLRVGNGKAAQRAGPTSPASGRPSIAVLPFRKDLANADDAYFADGMIEGIIHVLSGLEGLLVISRASTLGYASATFDARAVGRELGVRYVLYGGVQRSGSRVRIRTELSDAESGAVIRSDNYDGDAAELFDLQDRISVAAATTIAPQVRERELARAMRKHPESMTAYDLVLQGLDLLHRMDRESFARAHDFLQQAIVAEPGSAPANSYAALWHILRIAQGFSPDTRVDAAAAARLAAAATIREPNDATALAIQGYVLAYTKRDLEMAARLCERALAVGPNNALAWGLGSATCSFLGDGPGAVSRGERGWRLSPLDPFAFLQAHLLSQAHYTNGSYEQAVTWGRHAAELNAAHAPTFRTLVAASVALGRKDDVCEFAQRLLEVEPSFRLGAFAARTPLRGAVGELFVQRLREAGLPE